MPYSFTPDEKTAIQIALASQLMYLDERLKSYEGKKIFGNHTRALIESTNSALDKLNSSPPDEA